MSLTTNQSQNTSLPIFKDSIELFSRNWFIETGNGTVTKSPNVRFNSSYSLRIYSPDETDYALAYTSLPEGSNTDLHIRIWFYVDGSVKPSLMFISDLRGNAGVQARVVVTGDDSDVCRVQYLLGGSGYDPGSYRSICSITYNHWHRMDLTWSGGLYRVLIDGGSSTSFAPFDSSVEVNALYLGDSSTAGYKGLVYFDGFSIKSIK